MKKYTIPILLIIAFSLFITYIFTIINVSNDLSHRPAPLSVLAGQRAGNAQRLSGGACLPLGGVRLQPGGGQFHSLTATVYPPRRSQTRQYLILASGKLVRNDHNIYKNKYCSISQDLLQHYKYGDTIRVISGHLLLDGLWIIHDCMDTSMTSAIDFLIARPDLKYFRRGVYPVTIRKYNGPALAAKTK